MLDLPRPQIVVFLIDIGAYGKTCGLTNCKFWSLVDSKAHGYVEVYILPRLTLHFAESVVIEIPQGSLPIISLADLEFHKSRSIDLIIEVDVYEKGITRAPLTHS